MNTTLTINGFTITCDVSVAPSIVAELCKNPAEAPQKTQSKKPATRRKATAKKPATAPKPITPSDARGHQWYDDFESPHTEVILKRDTVQVKVERGFASEWHDKLRAAGFSWSKKGFWWASLDSAKRKKVADRHIANDAATAGMTKDERREYWANRNAARATGRITLVA